MTDGFPLLLQPAAQDARHALDQEIGLSAAAARPVGLQRLQGPVLPHVPVADPREPGAVLRRAVDPLGKDDVAPVEDLIALPDERRPLLLGQRCSRVLGFLQESTGGQLFQDVFRCHRTARNPMGPRYSDAAIK